MEPLRSAAKELFGLFVDDGYLALAVVIWTAFLWLISAKLEQVRGGGWLLFIGLAILLVESAWRRARR
jgi:hypothetical protein